MKTKNQKTTRTENNGRTRAFQGANGWYIATEDENGFHHQGNDRFDSPEEAWEDWDQQQADADRERAVDPGM